jgi:hypothetical protein
MIPPMPAPSFAQQVSLSYLKQYFIAHEQLAFRTSRILLQCVGQPKLTR